ncbi:hypothetical protein SFRURICE_016711 [Spodoptera frugiperda]|uniref:SFRICE_023225 n=1 Tax=Spodoptera frugiperda TaxID=7108 RepID=A0A2H1VUI8_SPOFR|nr:hypothetical protein SFRURICE_016711 [Spodoptera frugiperda]
MQDVQNACSDKAAHRKDISGQVTRPLSSCAVAVSRSIEDRYVKTSSARGGAESRYGDDGARTRPIAECRDDDLRAGDAGVRHLSRRAGNVARGGSAPRRNLSLTVAGSPSPSSSQCYL